jgi:hypothetical protein
MEAVESQDSAAFFVSSFRAGAADILFRHVIASPAVAGEEENCLSNRARHDDRLIPLAPAKIPI